MGGWITRTAIFQILFVTFASGVQLPTPTPVTYFIKQFFDEVKSSKTLTNLFNLGDDILPEELATGIFYGATAYGYQKDDKLSAYHAQEATKYIAASFDQLNYPLLVRLFSGALSKYAYAAGKLNEDNAQDMAKELAKVVEGVCRNTVDERIPRSKVTAWTIGFEDWLNNLGLFTKDHVGPIRETFGDEWIYLASNITDAPPQKRNHCTTQETFQKDAGSSDLKPKEDACFKVTPEVAAFRTAFIQAVLSSMEVKNLFDLGDLPPFEFRRAAFYTAQYLIARTGSKESASQALFTSQYTHKVDDVKLPRYLRVLGNIIGKYLQFKGVLTLHNASNYANQFVRFSRFAAKAYLNEGDDARAKYTLLSVSIGVFLTDKGLLLPNERKDFLFYYGNEWFCEALRQKMLVCQ